MTFLLDSVCPKTGTQWQAISHDFSSGRPFILTLGYTLMAVFIQLLMN